MSRRWTGVALLVGWLSLVGSARAQAPVPEPIPCAPSMPPAPHASQPVQGPLPPQLAPKGPPSDLLLPADIPGAFTDCPPEEECNVYFSLGGLGLKRQSLGEGSLVVIDRLNPTNLDTGARPLAERFLTNVQDYDDVRPHMGGGIEGTLGYEWGANAVELTGFYIFSTRASAEVDRKGRLDLPFFHPPLGFEGDNGMWLQADRNVLTLEQSLGNAEFNYRWWNLGVAGCQGIIGLRYTDMEERLNIFTGDDDLTVRDINLRPDPTRQANYRVVAHNHLVAGQLGFEWNYPVCSWVTFSWTGKGAWGANFYDQHHLLTRGDGFVGRATNRFDTLFSHEYEMGVFFDFWLCEGARLRAGYNMLWLVNVAEAAQQVNFDLANPEGQNIRQGSVFYHGPLVELQFLF
jgi:hypothetical protein